MSGPSTPGLPATGGGEAGLAVSHAEWLRTRTPPAPPALVGCILALLESHPEWESRSRADAFVDAADVLLRRVLVGNAAARRSALDLLAADACVTYAFEAAADEPETIARRAGTAKRRIAAIAEECSTLSAGASRPTKG